MKRSAFISQRFYSWAQFFLLLFRLGGRVEGNGPKLEATRPPSTWCRARALLVLPRAEFCHVPVTFPLSVSLLNPHGLKTNEIWWKFCSRKKISPLFYFFFFCFLSHWLALCCSWGRKIVFPARLFSHPTLKRAQLLLSPRNPFFLFSSSFPFNEPPPTSISPPKVE